MSFNEVNIQMQSYFIDQKYQYLKSKPLAKDSEKQKTFEDEKYQTNNKKGLCKRDIAKQKNTQKQKSAAEKRKSEYTQSEKSQNQPTEDQKKIDNKKSSRKRDIAKKIKLEDRTRQCQRRKNIQKICVSKKDGKSLKNKSAAEKRKSENEICTIAKKNKQVEEKILAKKNKNENEICPGTAAKKYNIGCNNCYTQSEKSQNQTTENQKKQTINCLHANKILKNKLNWKRGKDNVKAEKIFKRYVYLRKITNLFANEMLLK